jgi:iron complex outermembrane recepter protein
MKKRIFTLVFTAAMLLAAVNVFGQGTAQLTGKVVSGEESLIGANVVAVHTESGQQSGTITDNDGNFKIESLQTGAYKITVSFIGYVTLEKEVSVVAGVNDMGTISLESDAVGIAEVSVLASVAIDRKTPVAVTSLKAGVIEQRVGNQEFPEILKTTPSVYATKSGGGFGDARINVRGFDQRNVAVMINGIPVNDMENGWVYWSNWAGLSDVSSSIQVQRGLGASKLAIPSVGGSINIITNAAQMKKGGSGSVTIGNDMYQKYGFNLNSGLLDNGWAFSVQATHSLGNGYVDGTKFKAWSYFFGISKVFNSRHTISLTGVGAPQWHNQRTIGSYDQTSLQDYETFGKKYNYQWGYLNGEEFSWRKNFYHKPKVFLNHYWTISDKTDLKTSAYASIGRGGGTGDRGRISNGYIYASDGRIRNSNGLVRFDDIVSYNRGDVVPPSNGVDWGVKNPQADGPFAGQYVTTSSGEGFIRRASMNEHNWFGILSTLTHKLSDNLTLTSGIDLRYYKGIHYRKVDDLLGNDAYWARADDNNPENYITDPEQKYTDGNVLNYHNDGLVGWTGLFGQLEYSKDNLTAFLSGSLSNQQFKRIDYFNYLDSDPEQETGWQTFWGGTVKGGLNYNINANHNVFANAGYISRQPIFDNVFINFVNDVNEDVKNQTIVAFELGYGFRSSSFNANVNLYRTTWENRQFSRSADENAGPNGEEVEVLYNFENVGQLHQGIELEFDYSPMTILTLRGMASFGSWEYIDNFNGIRTDTDNNIPLGEGTMYMDGLKVGDAAQTTMSFGFDLKPVKGLLIYSTYSYYDNLYANFDISDSQFYAENPEILKLEGYGLLDAGISYKHDMKGFSLVVRANMNNVLDTEYISELQTNIVDDPSTPDVDEFMYNKGYYGFGRTWNLGLKVIF